MKRWHNETNWCKRQQSIDAMHGRKMPLGKYRKRHALDCGRVQCRVCHHNKYPKRELHEHEVVADLSFKEQLQEYQ